MQVGERLHTVFIEHAFHHVTLLGQLNHVIRSNPKLLVFNRLLKPLEIFLQVEFVSQDDTEEAVEDLPIMMTFPNYLRVHKVLNFITKTV